VILDLTDEARDRPIFAGLIRASKGRLSWDIGRAQLQIQRECDKRNNHYCTASGTAAPRIRLGTRRLWSGIFSINGSEQSPRYFNARSFGLRIADQSGRAVAIDLPELVLIYKPIAPGASIAGLSCQRPKNRKNCRGGHHGKSDPKCHYARRLSLSAKALLRQGGPFRLPARVLMVTPPARLHHGANTAAMGVRARQFRTAVVGLPQ
jgi:hypothetical protein